MKRGERKCIICSSQYSYCPSCGIGNPSETWRNLYCGESCREIFDLVSKYKNGAITVMEAQMKLKSPNINLSNKDSFGEEYKEVINEIISYKKESKKEVSEADKPVEKDFIEKRHTRKSKE